MIPSSFPPKEEIARLTARMLLEIKAVHFNAAEPFTLASGLPSPTYIDCRKMISYSRIRSALMYFLTVTVMREALLPQIQAMGNLLAAVPEFRGTEITATSQRYNQKMELVDETFSFRIGTEAAQKFFAGAISEQELIDQGAVLYADASKPPVKMDVSFVDAAD